MWLIFYVFGLDWRRWAALIEGRTTQLVAVLFIFLIIQEVAGFWWYLTGDFNMATTRFCRDLFSCDRASYGGSGIIQVAIIFYFAC